MIVSVTITFSVAPGEKHWRQMREVAESLTDSKSSVQVLPRDGDAKRLTARFTVPKARQEDIVDKIARTFWQVDDYADSAIGFSSEPRRTRRRRPAK